MSESNTAGTDTGLSHLDLIRFEQKLDELLKLAPTIEALGTVLVRRKDAITAAGLSKNALNDGDAFEERAHRRTFVEVGTVEVVKRRKRNRK